MIFCSKSRWCIYSIPGGGILLWHCRPCKGSWFDNIATGNKTNRFHPRLHYIFAPMALRDLKIEQMGVFKCISLAEKVINYANQKGKYRLKNELSWVYFQWTLIYAYSVLWVRCVVIPPCCCYTYSRRTSFCFTKPFILSKQYKIPTQLSIWNSLALSPASWVTVAEEIAILQ